MAVQAKKGCWRFKIKHEQLSKQEHPVALLV